MSEARPKKSIKEPRYKIRFGGFYELYIPMEKSKSIKGAILQSNYIPWKGYFDIIKRADKFIIYDSAQYTKNDWRNRNKIKTPTGLQWLTIPVIQEKLAQSIKDTRIADSHWRKKHWKSIVQNYNKAPFFKEYQLYFEELYLNSRLKFLSDINLEFIKAINRLLGINTEILDSTAFVFSGDKTRKIIDLCRETGINHYISGPSAQNYIDEALFVDNQIKVSYVSYDGYPEYPQLYPPFEHGVSIIDLVFNAGPMSNRFMMSF